MAKPAWQNRISMMAGDSWTFEVLGKPIAKKRPRVYRDEDGNSWGVNPHREAEQDFGWEVKSQSPTCYKSGALTMEVVFILPIPKKYSKMQNLPLPTGKPDVDNLLKFVLDSCNGILYKDDAQVVDLHGIKRYGKEPKTIIKIDRALEG